ncbi:MAG TPA: hypothetical protein VD996_16045 [Chitinophagaceae bacterium]|nr:hypothetical protein [Chitinophagaceae bacterium]
MDQQHASLETLKDIRRIMDRSSRFISLSGLSGVSAGVFAFIGVYFAYAWIGDYYARYNARGYDVADFRELKWDLFLLAAAVLTSAILFSFYFTWRKARKNGMPIWDHSSKKLFINMVVPLVAGGIFVLGLLRYDEWRFVAPATLIFYGLALVNASKYTLGDIRYLGYIEIILGLVNMWFIGYGLYFWGVGFGVLHIVYGLIMWWKYDYQ